MRDRDIEGYNIKSQSDRETGDRETGRQRDKYIIKLTSFTFHPSVQATADNKTWRSTALLDPGPTIFGISKFWVADIIAL